MHAQLLIDSIDQDLKHHTNDTPQLWQLIALKTAAQRFLETT